MRREFDSSKCKECFLDATRVTSAKELTLSLEATGSIRALICSQASKTAAPYMSELIDAAVGEAFGTYQEREREQ